MRKCDLRPYETVVELILLNGVDGVNYDYVSITRVKKLINDCRFDSDTKLELAKKISYKYQTLSNTYKYNKWRC